MPMDDDVPDVPPTHPLAPDPADSSTRRDFLITSATLGAGAALTGCAGDHAASPAPAGEASRASATGGPAPAAKPGEKIRLTINGQPQEIDADPRVTVLDALRERLNLTGTKKGCDHGQCGACTVLIDGRRVLSCLTLAAAAASGAQITTIEGLARGDELHPVQAAFIKHDAFQCGYCTPGQICSAVGLIGEGHAKTDEDIREQMSGNLCRCGAYVNIVAAVKEAMATAAPSTRA